MASTDRAGAFTLDRVEVAGLTIAYRRAGAGPPLLLLHGGFSDGRAWRRLLAGLSDEFTVVAWDAPGCGLSSDPPEGFRMDDYADCLAGLIGALGLESPHVLGHSFGGGLALALCGRHPALPRSLVLAGAYAGWAGSLPAGEVERRRRAAREVADRGPGRPTADPLPGLLSPSAPPGLAAELAEITADFHPAGARIMADAFAAADLRPVLAGVGVPTLLLHGERDERAPLRVARGLQRGIRGSRLVVLPDAGHESYLEAPARFQAEVRRFLRSVRD